MREQLAEEVVYVVPVCEFARRMRKKSPEGYRVGCKARPDYVVNPYKHTPCINPEFSSYVCPRAENLRGREHDLSAYLAIQSIARSTKGKKFFYPKNNSH